MKTIFKKKISILFFFILAPCFLFPEANNLNSSSIGGTDLMTHNFNLITTYSSITFGALWMCTPIGNGYGCDFSPMSIGPTATSGPISLTQMLGYYLNITSEPCFTGHAAYPSLAYQYSATVRVYIAVGGITLLDHYSNVFDGGTRNYGLYCN